MVLTFHYKESMLNGHYVVYISRYGWASRLLISGTGSYNWIISMNSERVIFNKNNTRGRIRREMLIQPPHMILCPIHIFEFICLKASAWWLLSVDNCNTTEMILRDGRSLLYFPHLIKQYTEEYIPKGLYLIKDP